MVISVREEIDNQDIRNNLVIRQIQPSEQHLLKNFLYEAIFQKDETKLLPKEIIEQPELKIYIDDFGKQGDLCLVADLNGELIGAVWTRIFSDKTKGFGYVDDNSPELSISLFKEYRNRGIGTALMKAVLELLRNKGYKKVSLSVQKDNYAYRMYQNLGFEVVKEDQEDYVMVCRLS